MVLITEVVQMLMFYDFFKFFTLTVDTIVSFDSGEHIYFGYIIKSFNLFLQQSDSIFSLVSVFLGDKE